MRYYILIICLLLTAGCTQRGTTAPDLMEKAAYSRSTPKGNTKTEKFLIKTGKTVAKKEARAFKKRNQKFERNLKRYDRSLTKVEKFCDKENVKQKLCERYLKKSETLYQSFPTHFRQESDVVILRTKQEKLEKILNTQK